MREYKYTIQPGETSRRQVPPANFIRVKEASGDVMLTVDDAAGNRLLDLTASQGMRCAVPQDFTNVAVRNDTGAVSTVVLVVGAGMVDDSQLSGTITMDKSTSISTSPDVVIAATSTAVVAAENSARREVMVSNLSSNTAAVRVGGAATGAGRGIEVLPGSTITLETSAAVYVYNTSAAAQSVAVLEVMD